MKRKFKIMSHQIEQLKEDSGGESASRRGAAGLVNGEWVPHFAGRSQKFRPDIYRPKIYGIGTSNLGS